MNLQRRYYQFVNDTARSRHRRMALIRFNDFLIIARAIATAGWILASMPMLLHLPRLGRFIFEGASDPTMAILFVTAIVLFGIDALAYWAMSFFDRVCDDVHREIRRLERWNRLS